MSDVAVPWIPHAMRAIIESHISEDSIVFEWGIGGSTRWFAERVLWVTSVEHDCEWEEWWHNNYESTYENVTPLYIPPVGSDVLTGMLSDPQAYRSSCVPGNFRNYASVIDKCGMYDVILVDGRARASCMYHAISHVRPGGLLVLDNTDRDWYLLRIAGMLIEWDRIDVDGHGPHLDYKWKATCFRRFGVVENE